MFDIFLNLSSIKMAPISLPNEILTENYFFMGIHSQNWWCKQARCNNFSTDVIHVWLRSLLAGEI